MKQANQKGFTLLEVIIAISTVSILLVTAYYSMGDRGDSAQLKSATADLTGNLNLARISAVRDTRPWAVKFDPSGNSYTILSAPGEDVAPEDPTDPIDWTDGDETTFRTASLPEAVSFASNQGDYEGNPVDDGVSHTDNLLIFEPNGTCSENGTIYLTIATGKTYAVTSRFATGQIKISSNGGSGWSY